MSVKNESQDDVEDYSSMSDVDSMLGRTQIPLIGERRYLEYADVDEDQLVFDMQKPLIMAIDKAAHCKYC